MPVAIITGASRGLGRALARALSADGWSLVLDARSSTDLGAVADGLPNTVALAGDVTDPVHRGELAAAARTLGGPDLLVLNASHLGPSPLSALADYPLDDLRRVYEVNVLAPLALVQLVLPDLPTGGTVVTLSSDAAVEAYPGWGSYGSSKAALDQLAAVLRVERPDLDVYAVDPGDMRTRMHQEAFPGEDISDRPEPETVVPAFRRLLRDRPAGARYRAADVAVELSA